VSPPEDHQVAVGHSVEAADWQAEVDRLWARMAARFTMACPPLMVPYIGELLDVPGLRQHGAAAGAGSSSGPVARPTGPAATATYPMVVPGRRRDAASDRQV
jgi:hypothetical protein